MTDQPQIEAPNYRIFITIATLDVTTAGVATLEADWLIVPRNPDQPTRRDRGRFTGERAGGNRSGRGRAVHGRPDTTGRRDRYHQPAVRRGGVAPPCRLSLRSAVAIASGEFRDGKYAAFLWTGNQRCFGTRAAADGNLAGRGQGCRRRERLAGAGHCQTAADGGERLCPHAGGQEHRRQGARDFRQRGVAGIGLHHRPIRLYRHQPSRDRRRVRDHGGAERPALLEGTAGRAR